jgi:hypothetical protein
VHADKSRLYVNQHMEFGKVQLLLVQLYNRYGLADLSRFKNL